MSKQADENRLASWLPVRGVLEQGVLLYEEQERGEHAYFPQSGMISLLTVMGNGQAIETATVGREGAVGAMSGLGPAHASSRAVGPQRLLQAEGPRGCRSRLTRTGSPRGCLSQRKGRSAKCD